MVFTGRAHSSFFDYNLTRPYPFRWFTPVAICLCTTAVIIFSFINVASSGYALVVQSTKDPNATLSENTWLNQWPSFMTTKIRSTCQSSYIPVGTQLFTNNTALTYTLTEVWQDRPDGKRNISSSLPYQNNLLEDCSISTIDIDFDSQDRSAVQLSHSLWGAKVSVFTTCSISNTPDGPMKLSLTMLYNYVPSTVRYTDQKDFLGSMFISRDKDTQASLYWGESLLSMSWATACRELQNIGDKKIKTERTETVNKGTVNFRSRPESTATSITALDFFDINYQFLELNWGSAPDFVLPPDRPFDVGSLAAREQYPNIWIKTDVLAKAAYSTVLTDLGQVNATHNLLQDPAQLGNFTANFSDWYANIANAIPGPAIQDYASIGGNTGPLGIKPSVFVLDYLCQVPRRKAIPNLIISVLVADLVFLQAVWQLYKLAVDSLLKKKIPDSQWCEGCRDSPEVIPLGSRSSEDDSS
jgi:hypothetical protein